MLLILSPSIFSFTNADINNPINMKTPDISSNNWFLTISKYFGSTYNDMKANTSP